MNSKHPTDSTAGDSTDCEMKFAKFAFGFDTFDSRKAYLAQHPELLSKSSLAAADAMILRWKADGFKDQVVQFRWMRTLLGRVVEVGMDEAFAEFALPSEEVISSVEAVMRADTPFEAISSVLRHRKFLNTKEAVSAFHFLRAKYVDDKDRLATINACWDAIGMVRRDQEPPKGSSQ